MIAGDNSHNADNRVPAHPVVFVWPDRSGRIDADWARKARRCIPGTWYAPPGAAESAGLEPLAPNGTGPAGVCRALLALDAASCLWLTTGLVLPETLWPRLAAGLGESHPGIRIPTSNLSTAVDPRPEGCDASPDWIDNAVNACGWQTDWPHEPGWPTHCAALSRSGLDAIARGADIDCTVLDTVYIHAPAAEAPAAQRPASARIPLGHLRERLAQLAAGPATELPRFDTKRPVTLHITHHWGGGIARWIDDVIAGDDDGLHLVLAAGSDEQDRRHGQWLRLYAAGAERGCLRDWQLSPAITDTDIRHPGYAAILAQILRRYSVGRLLVSSLIGHALDCLDTGLPTVQILHDGYPAWPLLDIDPRAAAGGLEDALAEHGDTLLFGHDQAEYWRDLAGAWRSRILDHGIALAAPSQAAITRWRHVMGEALPPVERIPHGFAGWPDAPDWTPMPPGDRKLRLVIVGRMNTGKGLNLLRAALPGIADIARITLLGCGRGALPLLGHAGVNLVFEYNHADLPRHIAGLRPDAALFLSTVPETWNYGLSEVRALGVVPVTTRRGSFIERIRDGVDGLLIEPEPTALVELVENLAADPARLERLRGDLPEEPSVASMLTAYARLAPPEAYRPAPPEAADPEAVELARRTGDGADLAAALHRARERNTQLERESDERSRWAQTMERQFRQRSRWAEQLESERRVLSDRLSATEAARRGLDQQLQAAERERLRLHDELDDTARRVDNLEAERHRLLNSRSWRITRPLRIASRLLRNARSYGLANPARWPRLTAALVHNLRLRGVRHTLYRLQMPTMEEPAPTTVVATETPQPGQPLVPVSLHPVDAPRVSVIVPVHNQVHFTAACLNSIGRVATNVPFEIIVVDDASSDETADYLERCDGLTLVSNPDNLGFIGSCNRGAAQARGEYLVFLNNDTTLTDHWLEALLRPFAQHAGTGIVGARLVFPDGSLQEAGGIIFSDGSGWNYGRNDDPDRPEYRFVCEVDYVSGACLAICNDLFGRLGGFDDHYAPAYYEDTDLCFRIRQEGLRVMYQPAATVVHHEGATSGTDEDTGAKRYQTVNREKFLKRWQAELARQPAPIANPENIEAGRNARHWRCQGRILVIDAITPTPDHDSGSLRLFALLGILVESGWRVSFMAENLAWSGRYSEALQQLGVECLCAPWIDDLESWLTGHGRELDMILVSRHYVLAPVMRLLREYAPHARVVFDTVDLHFLREEREAEVTGSTRIRRVAAQTRRQELDMIRAADHTLVVSPAERRLLGDIVPDADVHVVSNIHTLHGPGRSYAERRDLLFVGGFQHHPNVDAATWLMRDIFPLIRERLPDARLHIIGSRMPPQLRELGAPGIDLHGFVPDLQPWLEGCRLSLAPLRYGAGVKGKVNQAMAHGMPVVATACAAEGMYLDDGRDVLIADTTERFAEQVVRAYTDQALWQQLAAGGIDNVRQYFSVDAARAAINRIVDGKATVPGNSRDGLRRMA